MWLRINLFQIRSSAPCLVFVLGGSLFPEGFCDSHPGSLRDCVHSTACSIRSLWRSVEGAVRGVLEHVTVAELARAGQATAVWVSPPGEAETDPARTTET